MTGSDLAKSSAADAHFPDYEACTLCPRRCGVNRYQQQGFCKSGTEVRLARAALHEWEEPCISGETGSGAVFFSGCTLRCVFCQNYDISQEGFGKDVSVRGLADIFLRLADQGAANINLVTATHFLPSVLNALDLVRHRLDIPVVYNCGGYERAETIRRLDGYVDIYLPDLKYLSPAASKRYSAAEDYFTEALPAVREMLRQCGVPGIRSDAGLLKRGVIIRHMVLPNCKDDSIALLRRMKEELPQGSWLLSLMSQYTPFHKAARFPEINRRLTSYEYGRVLNEAIALGFDGYMQEKSSAKEEYTPSFDLTGVD